jgi:hypothetical protein
MVDFSFPVRAAKLTLPPAPETLAPPLLTDALQIVYVAQQLIQIMNSIASYSVPNRYILS